jgi:hypothetical protein
MTRRITFRWAPRRLSYGDERLKDRDVEEWAKIVWINLLESAEVAFVTRQSNVPDLRWVTRWRRGLLETLLRLSCEWDVFREKRLQIESLRGSAGFGYFVVMSCIEVWVGYNVIMTEVWHSRPQL